MNDPIVLTVYATGAPDLTLIDLPDGSVQASSHWRVCKSGMHAVIGLV